MYAHLYDEKNVKDYKRGEDYVNFRPDRVAMQDATAQTALLVISSVNRFVMINKTASNTCGL